MKKRAKVPRSQRGQPKDADPPSASVLSKREYFNSSMLDYSEPVEIVCAKCGELIMFDRVVMGGKPVGGETTICEKCTRAEFKAEQNAFWSDFRKGKLPGLKPELPPYPSSPGSRKAEEVFPEKRLTLQEFEEMGRQNQILRLIRECALGGDEDAIRWLIHLAWGYVEVLSEVGRRRPELLRPAARKQIHWPSLIGKGDKLTPDSVNGRLTASIQLGQDSVFRAHWHSKAPATRAAIVMYGWLEENADLLDLPALTAESRRQWFERGWQALLKATDGRPDHDAYYADIGKSAIRKHAAGKADRRGMPEQTEGMKRDDMIARIKTLLWKSFSNYTKYAPPH